MMNDEHETEVHPVPAEAKGSIEWHEDDDLPVSAEAQALKWSCFLGQVCGLAKVYLVCVHAAFRMSVWVKYAVSGVRLSRAV